MIGERVPFRNVLIPQDKIIHYLLELTHPDGGSKARFFLGHGFRIEEPKTFADALFDHVSSHPVFSVRHTRWGAQIAVAGPMAMPDGTVRKILSVWLHQESGDGTFVTAYPHE